MSFPPAVFTAYSYPVIRYWDNYSPNYMPPVAHALGRSGVVAGGFSDPHAPALAGTAR